MKDFYAVFKSVDDVLWKDSGCSTELDYTEQTSWVLFLKYIRINFVTGRLSPTKIRLTPVGSGP